MTCGQAVPNHLYAYDSQLYASLASRDSTAAPSFSSYTWTLSVWTSVNKLKQNPEKTEFLLIGKVQQERLSSYVSVSSWTLGVETNPTKSAQNLESNFDKIFTFCSHISPVCSSWFYHNWDLQDLGSPIPRFRQSANYLLILFRPATLITAIHFCLAKQTWTSQNFSLSTMNWPELACVVMQSPSFSCSVPLLRSLHWLPVKFVW